MKQNDSHLVIRDVPILFLVLGILFAGVGTLIIMAGDGPDRDLLIFGGIFASVGMGFLLLNSVLIITADRTTRTLKLDYRSALRHTLRQVPFDEIAGINVDRIRGGKGGFTYRLTLLCTDGQVIPFRSYGSSGWERQERRAVHLREFLGIQDSNRIPSGILPAELSQPAEIHETDGVHWRIQPMFSATSSTPTGARWHSPDFKTPGIFLLVAQKAEGQSSQGFPASLGSKLLLRTLSFLGFSPEDTPGLEQAVTMTSIDPALENHFFAYTNSPSSAYHLLNSTVTAQISDWAARYPLKQTQKKSASSQLMTLFGPNGVCLVALNLAQPNQAHELVSLGVELVKSQSTGLEQFSSAQ